MGHALITIAIPSLDSDLESFEVTGVVGLP